MTTNQLDIFGNSHAVNPTTGKAIDASNLNKYCNLCCISFANDVLAETGHYFYASFHVCERCNARLEQAEQERGIVTRFKDVDFLMSNGNTAKDKPIDERNIMVAVAGNVAGFIGTNRPALIGRPLRYLPYKRIDDEDMCMSLYALASDVGVIDDSDIAIHELLIDRMIVEMHDNVAYNRLGSETD